MIALSVQPNQIPFDQPTDIVLRLINHDSGPCTSIRITFRMPKELLLIRGNRKCQLQLLTAGSLHELFFRVRAKSLGEFSILAANFSYQDQSGRVQRILDGKITLSVIRPTTIVKPTIQIVLNPQNLEARKWLALVGIITNTGHGAVKNINLSAEGPTLSVRNITINDLKAGETKSFTLTVRVEEAGPRFPIDIVTTFHDENDQVYRRKWQQYIVVREIKQAPTFSQQTNIYGSITGQVHTGEGDINTSSNVEQSPNNLTSSRHDAYTPFERGLERFMTQITSNSPYHSEALVYQHRLQENINNARRFGDTLTRQAERAEVIDQLNRLTLSVLNVSFNDLCKR